MNNLMQQIPLSLQNKLIRCSELQFIIFKCFLLKVTRALSSPKISNQVASSVPRWYCENWVFTFKRMTLTHILHHSKNVLEMNEGLKYKPRSLTLSHGDNSALILHCTSQEFLHIFSYQPLAITSEIRKS